VKDTDRIACLTLDLEQDYGRIDAYACFAHVDKLCEILLKREAKLTAFVVGRILDERHEVINKLTQFGTDFALHSYSHNLVGDQDTEEEVKRSKKSYENYFGQAPLGYRAPQGRISKAHFKVLREQGFVFDASVIPSWRPGIYSNLTSPLHPYCVESVLEIPFSVIPRIRLPLIMSYIKLLGRAYTFLMSIFGLPHIVVFDFHLHDLFKTESFEKLPMKYRIIHNRNASEALGLFDTFVALLGSQGFNFLTMSELADKLLQTCSDVVV
jgi:hypothetical protein